MRRLLSALVVLGATAAPSAADTVRYFHLDGVGNIRAITNQAGTVVERHDYLPFGEECTTGPCASNPGVGAGQPRKFTGKERDVETGLDYFGARYYGSKIGRFTTVDPVYTWNENLLDPQRWNRYAYARNNPLKYVDPDGRAIDVAVDVVSIGYGFFDIGRSVYRGEGVTGTQVLALGGDIVGAAVPFVTGIGAVIRTGSKVDNLADFGKGASNLVDAERPFEATAENIARMQKGKPPIGADGKAVELHHQGQKAGGQLQEMTRTGHRGAGNYKTNHPEGNKKPSEIDRREFRKVREEHWKKQAEGLKKQE